MHYPKEITNLAVEAGDLIVSIRRCPHREECVIKFDSCYPNISVKLDLSSCKRFSPAMADFLERLEDIIKEMSRERRRAFANFLEQDFNMAKTAAYTEEVPF